MGSDDVREFLAGHTAGNGRHLAHGLTVGSILLAAALLNMAMLPYPIWFWVNVIVFPVCFYFGAKLG